MKRCVGILIAIATLIFVFFILFDKFEVIKENFFKHKFYFLLIALLYIIGRVLEGHRLNLLTSHFGLTLKIHEYFGLSMMVPFYNLIFPNAGIVSNALYLKSKHNFRFKDFVSAGLINLVLAPTIYGLFGVIASVIYTLKKGTPLLLWPLAIYILVISASISLLFIPIPTFFKRYNIFNRLYEAVENFKAVKLDKSLIFSLLLNRLGITLAYVCRYYIVFKALSFNAPFINIAAIIPLTELSNFINIIPSNLAIREAVTSSASTLIGYNLADGLLVASIDRAVLLTVTLILGTCFFWKLRYFKNLTCGLNIAEKVIADD